MKKMLVAAAVAYAGMACEPIETYNAFSMEYKMWNEGIVQHSDTIVPVLLFEVDEIADSLYTNCDCDSVTYKTRAVQLWANQWKIDYKSLYGITRTT